MYLATNLCVTNNKILGTIKTDYGIGQTYTIQEKIKTNGGGHIYSRHTLYELTSFPTSQVIDL